MNTSMAYSHRFACAILSQLPYKNAWLGIVLLEIGGKPTLCHRAYFVSWLQGVSWAGLRPSPFMRRKTDHVKHLILLMKPNLSVMECFGTYYHWQRFAFSINGCRCTSCAKWASPETATNRKRSSRRRRASEWTAWHTEPWSISKGPWTLNYCIVESWKHSHHQGPI